jgi:hypothetical protein
MLFLEILEFGKEFGRTCLFQLQVTSAGITHFRTFHWNICYDGNT